MMRLFSKVVIFAIAIATQFIVLPVFGQVPQMAPNRAEWWRNGASLDMDFYNNRYMVSVTAPVTYTSLTQFISAVSGTFTRASSATYFDNAGVLRTAAPNQPRLDYDPSTLAPRGILIEEARTNLLPYSNNFSQWGWGSGVTTTQDTASPDGTVNAWTLTQVSATGTDSRRQYNATVAANTNPYVFSAFFKKENSTPAVYPAIRLFTVGYTSISTVMIDTYTGAVLSNSPAGRYGIIDSGNYWRVWGSIDNNASSTTIASCLYPAYSSTWSIAGYPVNGGSAVFYGAQLEQASFPTSYIATNGGTVTRAADDLRISSTTGWYKSTIGTLGAEALSPGLHDAPATYNGVVALNGDGGAGTVNAMHMMFVQNTSASYPAVEVFTDPGGTKLIWQDATFYNMNSAPNLALFPPNLLTKWVLAYKNNDSRAAINGTLGPAGTATQVPTSITMLRIGANRAGPGWNSSYNGVVRRVWYMPTRQPDYSLPDYTR